MLYGITVQWRRSFGNEMQGIPAEMIEKLGELLATPLKPLRQGVLESYCYGKLATSFDMN
jgi:hypothetical protein